MATQFTDTSKSILNKNSKKEIDEDGNIVLGENVQIILESTITNIEE